MKFHRVLCLIAVVMSAQLALAELPVSNDTFGTIEGTLDFCAQADSQAAPKYLERKKGVVRDVPAKEVAEARKTKGYKEAYAKMNTDLGKAPKDQAVAACKAYLEGK